MHKGHQPLPVQPSKNTEHLWNAAERGNGATFINLYVTRGGNLKLTNEYGETAVKVLMKQSNDPHH